jgi:HPt (histidine-containing phosphotransfer) domain-containing protein
MTEDENSRIIIHADIDLEDLIPGFLENRHKDIIEIESLLASGDYETTQRLGHSMKGAGGGY